MNPRPFVSRSVVTLLVLATACGNEGSPLATAAPPPALRIALAAHAGATGLDDQVRASQAKVRERADVPRLERLATLFIAKARATGDPGFYKLAEVCADAMPSANGGRHAASLVRGHVRHALHDFAGAETIARELVAARGMFLDHGLLGDVLLDLGHLDEARDVYQRMLDLKPCLQSYSRGAQVRWLMGDLAGCRELLDRAAGAGSRRDPESLAWVFARRAVLELQANDADQALVFAASALELVPDYPQALLARGRAASAKGDHEQAAASLAAAVASYPLPEHLWAHADSLRAAGRDAEAAVVEAELERTGEREDPRTFALWLATLGRDPAKALRIADAEFRRRQDPYTLDALAVARLRAGDVDGARAAMQQALATGVRDARLAAHAAAIAFAAGEPAAARRHADAATERIAALLPSERRELSDLSRRL